jgi:hypothetical protein
VATPPPIPTFAPEAVAPPPTPAPAPAPPPVQTPPPAPAVEQPVAAEEAADPGFEWQQENATMPPQSRPAAGVTSFEWPAAEGERKKKSKGLFIGIAAVLVALLAAVLGFVLLSGGDSGNTAEATPPAPPPPVAPKPPPPVANPPAGQPELIAQSLALRDQPVLVVANLRFSGGTLGSNAVKTKDANMSDGRGLAEVRQKGVRTAVSTGSVPGVTFRVRRSGDVLRISAAAKKGAFTKLEARRDQTGKAIAIKLTKKPAPVAKPRSGSPPPPPPPTGGGTPPPANPPPTSPQPPVSPPPPTPPSGDRIRRRSPPPPPPPSCDRIRC